MRNLAALFVSLIFANSMIFANSEPEELLGFKLDEDGLSFQVHSGGCTDKEDFELKILETNPVQLELVRLQMDFCDAYFPYGKTIKWSFEEIGIQGQFLLRNKLVGHYIVF